MANFNVARVYADVNQSMPRSYWDYDSVNISESGLSPFPGPAPVRPARAPGAVAGRSHTV